MYPGLGSPRYPRCLFLLDPQGRKGELITPVLRDSAAVAGTGIGAMLSAVYGLNTEPAVRTKVASLGCWGTLLALVSACYLLQIIPPLRLFSGASSAFGGYALPRFVQITVTSYYATSSASHHWVSCLTRRIEDSRTSRTDDKLPK